MAESKSRYKYRNPDGIKGNSTTETTTTGVEQDYLKNDEIFADDYNQTLQNLNVHRESRKVNKDTYPNVASAVNISQRMKATDITNLRTATRGLVQYNGTAEFDWTESIISLSSKIQAEHLEEVRQVVDDALNMARCMDCSSACSQNCEPNCTAECKDTCYSSCSGGCYEDCAAGCGTGCAGGCSEACKAGCGNECTNSCSSACWNHCGRGCTDWCGGDADYCGINSCHEGCAVGCTSCCGDCNQGCSGSCSNCTDSCGAGCVAACKVDCGTACTDGCAGNCATTCGNKNCTEGCYSSCSGADCTDSCQDTCKNNCWATCLAGCNDEGCTATARYGTDPGDE